MREIKFRAWDKDKKRMVQSGLSFDYENTVDLEEHVGVNNLYDAEGEQVEDFILMQFTGLLDKNGKEIYEGDILKYKKETKSGYVNHFHKVFFSPRGQWQMERDNTVHALYAYTKNHEVVGSIYETPELVK